MDEKLAIAIINEVKNAGFETRPIPYDAQETIELAEYWIEDAERGREQGVKHPALFAILELAEQAKMEDTYPRRSSGGLSESDEREVDAFYEKIASENLPVPEELQDAPEPMPSDLSAVADKKIRFLSGHYNAYLNRARWKLAIATSDLANASHLRDAEYKKSYRHYHGEITQRGDRATKDLVDSFVSEDPKIVEWDGRLLEHQNQVTMYKTLVDIYSSNVDRLSREWTMRQNEWERSR